MTDGRSSGWASSGSPAPSPSPTGGSPPRRRRTRRSSSSSSRCRSCSSARRYGVPGLTETFAPHWRGDLLLILSGLAYASYSLFGRDVLGRHAALRVTASSILWGVAALLPLAAAEWAQGRRPAWTAAALAGTLYLALVITAFGYLAWNWALRRVEAARAAIFLNVQPVVGALLGVALLGEPLTAFTLAGGALIVTGLGVAFGNGRR